MPSLIPGYEYDIFISYRHKDNKYDGWVTEFVANLRKELEATFKEDVSIYFDENPHDGLLETHYVDRSLETKLKCVIFIPIISQTYCDIKSFAWEHEFVPFNRLSSNDVLGSEVELLNGNVGSRVLPVKIHEIDDKDKFLAEKELGRPLRSIDFIYKSSGVNRPLRPNEEQPGDNSYHSLYRNQINKVANAIKDIISALQDPPGISYHLLASPATVIEKEQIKQSYKVPRHAAEKKSATHMFSGIRRNRNLKSIILFSFGPALFLSFITGFFIWNFRSAPIEMPMTSIRSSILLPENAPLEFIGEASLGIGRKSLAISKDGKKIAYIGRSGETTKLMIRNLDDDRVQEINNTDGAFNPVFSPDGKYLSFFQKNFVKQVLLQNYTVSLLAEKPNLWDATWSTEGELFFSSDEGRNLYRFSQKKLDLIAKVDLARETIIAYRSIQRIPRTDLLLASNGWIDLIDLKTWQHRRLDLIGTNARYVPTGHIVYLNGSSLMAVAFDLSQLSVTSDPVAVITGLRSEGAGDGQFDFSSDGKIVFVQGEDARKAELISYDHKTGLSQSLNFPPQEFSQFAISPDGTRIAVSELHVSRDIFIYELKTGQVQRVTSGNRCALPVWYPDGKKLFFRCGRDVFYKIVDKDQNQVLFMKNVSLSSFSEDGKIAVVRRDPDMYVRTMNDTSLTWIARGIFGAISSNGRYIVYNSTESGESHVYVQPLPTTGAKWQISTEGGSEEARWSDDGKKVVYRAGRKWMEVSFTYTPTFSFDTPKVLFEGDYLNPNGYSYDIFKEDDRFLLLRGSSVRLSTHISMIQGWFDELNKLAPAAK